jgi:Na+-driven multidrug efflux pump
MIISVCAVGVGQGVLPLLGFCVGAKNWARYKAALKFAVIFSALLSLALTAVCFVFTRSIVGAFLTEPDALEYGVLFVRIFLSTAFLFGLFYCMANALQSMGAAVASLIVNLSRQGFLLIPALFIMREFFGLRGLIWAQPTADVLSFALVVVLHTIIFRKMVSAKEL